MSRHNRYPSEQALVRALVARNPDGWQQLIESYGAGLAEYIRHLLRSRGKDQLLAEEIAEAVWFSLVDDDYRRLRRFRKDLAKYLRARARDELRKSDRREKRERQHVQPLTWDPLNHAVERRLGEEEFQEFLDTLTPQERRCCEAKMDGIPKEAMLLLFRTEGNLRQLDWHVRHKFRQFLGLEVPSEKLQKKRAERPNK
jgi:hypothetical protein